MLKLLKVAGVYPKTLTPSYVLIEDELIIAIATEPPKLTEETIFEDLSSFFIYPGFNDSHMHLMGYGASLSQCLLGDVHSIDALKEALTTYCTSHFFEIITGRGWNQDLFKEKRLPNRYDLDACCSERPVILYRACGHIAVLNSKAIAHFKLTADMQITGGAIDVINGELTGIIRENALSLVKIEPSKAQLMTFVETAQAHLMAYGITSVQTDDLIMVEQDHYAAVQDAFKALVDENKLKIRVYEQSQFFTPDLLRKAIKDGYNQNNQYGRYTDGPLKVLADGSLGSRTAKIRKGYHDAPGEKGLFIHSEDDLRELVKICQSAKLDLAIHGIGDATIELILNVFEGVTTGRNSIIHCQIMDDELILKMAKQGISALVQPVFLEYDMTIVPSRVGPVLARTSYAYKKMLSHGIILAFGSDAPVENPNPMRGLYYAIYRERPDGLVYYKEEGLTFEEAFDAYTSAGAYFSYETHIKGRLEPGYLADFFAVTKPLESLHPSELLTLKVEKTYIGGECTFTRK
ncbi:MAG: hypothetical protein BGO41_11380 [Clostridiales bacterium 38-18]|nr:MAG: hypothetical protein BGO41_11380 [Clostridiales bacterium 38-18]